jgi:formate dehydrogenase maturation protein FdhE
MAFRFEAPSLDDAAALAARCPSDAALSNVDVAALQQAHARHALTADQQKMMEEGTRCPICGCPPASFAAPSKGL